MEDGRIVNPSGSSSLRKDASCYGGLVSGPSLLAASSCSGGSEGWVDNEMRKMSYSEIMDKKITSL